MIRNTVPHKQQKASSASAIYSCGNYTTIKCGKEIDTKYIYIFFWISYRIDLQNLGLLFRFGKWERELCGWECGFHWGYTSCMRALDISANPEDLLHPKFVVERIWMDVICNRWRYVRVHLTDIRLLFYFDENRQYTFPNNAIQPAGAIY